MKHLIAGLIVWRGLFLGVEHTAPWYRPLTPSPSASATAVITIGKASVRAVYIQPLVRGNAPLVQVGVNWRLF